MKPPVGAGGADSGRHAARGPRPARARRRLEGRQRRRPGGSSSADFCALSPSRPLFPIFWSRVLCPFPRNSGRKKRMKTGAQHQLPPGRKRRRRRRREGKICKEKNVHAAAARAAGAATAQAGAAGPAVLVPQVLFAFKKYSRKLLVRVRCRPSLGENQLRQMIRSSNKPTKKKLPAAGLAGRGPGAGGGAGRRGGLRARRLRFFLRRFGSLLRLFASALCFGLGFALSLSQSFASSAAFAFACA